MGSWASSRTGYKKLAHFQNGVSILGEIFSRTGCQFGVTYPPKKYPSPPPRVGNKSSSAMTISLVQKSASELGKQIELAKVRRCILLLPTPWSQVSSEKKVLFTVNSLLPLLSRSLPVLNKDEGDCSLTQTPRG